jgi:hypothetical protein
MDRNFRIVAVDQDAAAFSSVLDDSRFAAIEAHPQAGVFGRSYYPAVHGDNHRNYSFAVEWQNEPRLVVLCSVIDGVLGMHGIPARIFAEPGLDAAVCKASVKQAFAHIDEIAVAAKVREVVVSEPAAPQLSPVGESSLSRGAKADVTLIGMVDIDAGPAVWKKSLRKSFQQLINWGRKNFSVGYINAENFSHEAFDRFRHFHAHVAGRVTRPIESWNAMAETVRVGRGEVIMAEIAGKLTAAVLFVDGTVTSLYMTGVYDRDSEDPLAHYMIWHGMERAHLRGMKDMELGPIHQLGAIDTKQYNIGFFKRGFVTRMDANFDWRWKPASTHNR